MPPSPSPSAPLPTGTPARKRLLIEDWLPAAAIGVECMRERSTGQQPPDKRLHVWWARRPLTVSRAAVLGSLLPADFDREMFERLLGLYARGELVVANELLLNLARDAGGGRIKNPHGPRAFSAYVEPRDFEAAHQAMAEFWGDEVTIIDPMAGGGSIPLEAARCGINVIANEYNPVACSILEATVDYPFRFGPELADKARHWGKVWRERFVERMERFYEVDGIVPAYTYLFARTVPCPDTGHPTPLVPDWHLLKPKSGARLVAEPVPASAVGRVCRCAGEPGSNWAGERVSRGAGEQLYASHEPDCPHAGNGLWTIRVREVGKRAGQLRQPPVPTYGRGNATSLFTGTPIPGDYIKAMAQRTDAWRPQGKLGSQLYAIATKATTKLNFRAPEKTDLDALDAAERELERVRPDWVPSGPPCCGSSSRRRPTWRTAKPLATPRRWWTCGPTNGSWWKTPRRSGQQDGSCATRWAWARPSKRSSCCGVC